MATIKSTDGFHVYGWMVKDLQLEGGDLLAFAMVYSYTKGHAGTYTGNTAYLSAWTGWSDKTSKAHLQNLTRLGLIQEVRGRENNTPFCHYILTADFYEKISQSPRKNFQKHCEDFSQSTAQKFPTKIEYNNKNIENIFTPPTLEEVAAYARQRGFVSPEGFAYKFITYYELNNWHLANGKPMKDWKRAVLTWEPESKTKKYPVPPSLLKQATTQEITAWLR